MNQRSALLLLTAVFSIGLIVYTLRDSRSRHDNWRKEIWADQAGYYVYLPLAFNYGFDARQFPENSVENTGFGFRFEEDRVITKYPIGVAMLVAPFYLGAQALAPALGKEANGFSDVYARAIRIAAAFYFIVGLIFLFRFLSIYFRPAIVLIGISFVLWGTNVIYYVLEPGMSHVYSFSLFALLLFTTHRLIAENDSSKKARYYLAFCVISSLLFNIRQLNILFIPFVVFITVANWNQFAELLRYVFQVKRMMVGLLIFSIVFLPQALYNLYAHDTVLLYSYQNESFSQWSSPKILELWFSPVCGMFSYNPLLFFVLGAIALSVFQRKKIGFLLITLFLVFSYLYASWHDWRLGCSYGCRALVDVMPLLCIPLFSLLERLTHLFTRIVVYTTLCSCVLYNLNLSSSYETCFFGKGDWDWAEYKCLITRGTVMQNVSNEPFSSFLFDTESGYLRTCFGHSVTVNDHQSITAASAQAEREQLTLIYLDSDNVGMKRADGTFLSCDGERANVIVGGKKTLKSWERFELVRLQGDTLALKAHNGKFIVWDNTANGAFIANADVSEPCAKFIFEPTN